MREKLLARFGGRRPEAALAAEEGFTLIELMVVVLIIAILMAIAIPQFLGTKKTAQDSAAQQDLTNALTDAEAVYAQLQTFSGINTTSMQNAEKNITFTTAAPAQSSTNTVGLEVTGTSPTDFEIAAASQDGKCWLIWTADGQATWYGEDPLDTGGCTATDFTGTALSTAPTQYTTCPSSASLIWGTRWPTC
jgi:prepilin-type N-terminal cleavage/methylation domain-containing protein